MDLIGLSSLLFGTADVSGLICCHPPPPPSDPILSSKTDRWLSYSPSVRPACLYRRSVSTRLPHREQDCVHSAEQTTDLSFPLEISPPLLSKRILFIRGAHVKGALGNQYPCKVFLLLGGYVSMLLQERVSLTPFLTNLSTNQISQTGTQTAVKQTGSVTAPTSSKN